MSDFIQRTVVSYKNISQKFSRENDDFNNQYYKIYNVRLEKMLQYLLEAIKQKWNDKYRVCKLYKLSEETDDTCVVIGTLFKDQKLKPSVLKELAESNQLMPQPIVEHYTDESDVLYLEDELQRFQLEGGLDGKLLVTGVTCALLGRDKGGGKFEIIDYTFAGLRTQIEKPMHNEDTYVVFVSGLHLSQIEKSALPLRLFVNWISGHFGNLDNINVPQICRVIIAGNSIKTSNTAQVKFTMSVRTNQNCDIIDAVKTLDNFLIDMCKVIEVDLMPGCNDPSNYVLPQKQIHHCMLPKSVLFKSLNRVTNPYQCEIGGFKFLGTSGEPVSDILRYSDIEEPIEALENCLKWNHMAPTAPDTLGCYPYYDNDPFILEDCPHIFFAGNQKKFDTKLINGDNGQRVRLICIPEFSTSFTACVLNLKNMDCIPITFEV